MRLQAALLPPEDVQVDLAAVAASVPGGGEQLALVPAHLLHLRLANFGEVSLGDAARGRSMLQREIAQQPAMSFRFRGGVALEPLGDNSVWAKLEGDVEQLTGTANMTARVVRRLGLVVDRRLPRTLVRLGRITPTTTETYLQRLLDRLDAYAGPEWVCSDLALLRTSDVTQEGILLFEVVERFRLQSGDLT